MRWGESVPRLGQTRVRTKYLLLPMTIGEETRWLESATFTEEFVQDGWCRVWVPIRFIDAAAPGVQP